MIIKKAGTRVPAFFMVIVRNFRITAHGVIYSKISADGLFFLISDRRDN